MPNWSDWSDWALDPSRNVLRRVRQDEQGNLQRLSPHESHPHGHLTRRLIVIEGNLDYDYNFQNASHAETPRRALQTIEDLCEELEALSPGSSYESSEYELDSGPQERTESSASKGTNRNADGGTERSKREARYKEKDDGKGKARATRRYREKRQQKKASQRKRHNDGVSTHPGDEALAATSSAGLLSKTRYALHSQHYTGSKCTEPEAVYATTSKSCDLDEVRKLQKAFTESQKMQNRITRGGAEGASSTSYTTSAYGYESEDGEFSLSTACAVSDEDHSEEIDPSQARTAFNEGGIQAVNYSEIARVE
ncbi:hypothetical protein E4U60_007046 [Claviceps pazoutovae]|uniref:Uncharacterized protein n=1 Tax=Claviceps pazoutovae TaxID=1649127 RepID=A0A9P7MGE2_9HYPO|nr:hypothetical protein E4U60_007046 [Claviceps pazoutovae]